MVVTNFNLPRISYQFRDLFAASGADQRKNSRYVQLDVRHARSQSECRDTSVVSIVLVGKGY